MLKLAILISGYGSNLQAIIDAIHERRLNAQIEVVISDQPNAYGLIRAKNAGIKTEVIPYSRFASRVEFDMALLKLLSSYQPGLIILAGFMRILPSTIIYAFPHKILNIHPALLPKYPGLKTHEKVIAHGDREHGTTVHIVTENLDAGPILAQAKLTVRPEDTPMTLKERIQSLEHQLYPKVIQWFAENRITLRENIAYIDGKKVVYSSKNK